MCIGDGKCCRLDNTVDISTDNFASDIFVVYQL